MDDGDALKVARAAVDAARSLREQMREDWGHHVEPEETLAAEVDRLEGENARLRAAFDRIALDPAEYRHALGHVADCEDNCDQCRQLAQHALDGGVDAQERATDILNDRARLRAVVKDITAHATPIAEDDDGFVAVGYTITIGAVHRALAALSQLDGNAEVSDE